MTLEALFRRGLDRLLEAPHRVHFYHLYLFAQGTGKHSVDFIDYTYDDKSLLLVSKGQVQQFRVNRTANGFLLIFTAEFLRENATARHLYHSLQIFEHALFTPCIRVAPAQHQMLKRLCLLLQEECQNPVDELSIELLRHLVRVIILQTERIQRPHAASRQFAPHYQRFVAFRRLLEDHRGSSRSVRYYAGRLGVSAKQLNAVTRQVVNQSAKAFIAEQVMLEAQRLLAQGQMPIKEIAYELGFSEPTNLVKFFKKHARLSPAAFRKRYHPAL